MRRTLQVCQKRSLQSRGMSREQSKSIQRYSHTMLSQNLSLTLSLLSSLSLFLSLSLSLSLSQLLARYPKSVRILRAYGFFLEEIKNDMETAQLVYRSADELEEAKSRKHRVKSKTKQQKMKHTQSKSQ